MRVAIIYASCNEPLDRTAKLLGKTIEQKGHQVDYLLIGQGNQLPNFRRYNFVYLGSISEGLFSGKIPTEIAEYLKQCHGLQGSKSAAFLMKRRFGNNTKGLKKLMGILESLGSQVMDFQVINTLSDAETLGKRLTL